MYTILSGTADFYAPVDTRNLIQSRTYRIRKTVGAWRLTYGYYATSKKGYNYAAHLHETTGWEPKPPGTPGKPNGAYNPNAQPDWMNIAWNEAGDEALAAFGRMIEP